MGTPSSHSRIPRPINFSPTNESGASAARMVTRGTIDRFRGSRRLGRLVPAAMFTRRRWGRVPEPAAGKIK